MNNSYNVAIILLINGISNSIFAQNTNNNSSALSIKSETSLYSADINIKEKKGEQVTDDEKKEDKKRKSLGIGEPITLTLEGKSFLMEPTEDIEWSIDEGEKLLEPINNRSLKGTKKISATVRKDLTKDDIKEKIKISVKVKQEKQSPTPIQFTVIFPDKLTAAHIPSENSMGTPSTLVSAETDNWAGSSMQLKISIGPTNVNFSNILVTEQDGGETPPVYTQGSLSTRHVADTVWKINSCHEFDKPDHIGSSQPDITLDSLYTNYPNKYSWKCLFKTSNGVPAMDEQGMRVNNSEFKPVYEAFETIEEVNQEFIYYKGMNLSADVTAVVSKYSKPRCTVERKRGQIQIYSTDETENKSNK